MPKFIAAMLCGTLIVTFPKMLDLTLGHAENSQNPFIAYGLLAGATSLFVGLIAWYMWLGYKATPSGFFEVLRKFAESIGDKKDSEITEKETGEHSAGAADAQSYRAIKSTTGIGA